jgi:hypothetical protein
MKNANRWTLSLLLMCMAVGCASQTPATSESNDQQSDAPDAQESASVMPLGSGDMLGARMFNNSSVQVADVQN